MVGREIDYDALAGLARIDERVAGVLDDAADAVGQLAATVALVTRPERLLVSGEGAGMLLERRRRLDAAFRRADLGYVPLPVLDVAVVGFFEWARGSAALAIREHMTRPS